MPRRQEEAPRPTFMSSTPGATTLAASNDVALTAHQGDDKRWIFRFKQTGGGPFDLTGYTAAMEFRLDVADTAMVPAAVPTVEVTDPANGEVTVTLDSEVSRLLTQVKYLWEMEIVETSDDWTTTILGGTLTVTKEITRTGA